MRSPRPSQSLCSLSRSDAPIKQTWPTCCIKLTALTGNTGAAAPAGPCRFAAQTASGSQKRRYKGAPEPCLCRIVRRVRTGAGPRQDETLAQLRIPDVRACPSSSRPGPLRTLAPRKDLSRQRRRAAWCE